MSVVIPFKGREEFDAKQNLRAFIPYAQKNCPFKNVDWNSPAWTELREAETGRQSKGGGSAMFAVWGENTRGKKVKTPLEEPFLTFAKAAYSEHFRLRRNKDNGKFLAILKILEWMLKEQGKEPCVTQLTEEIFDQAAAFARQNYAESWSYGQNLQYLIEDVINPARLTPHTLTWASSIPYTKATRNDAVNKEANTDKLPAIPAIVALGSIFHEPKSERDMVTTAFTALAMFAPSRAGEILTLPADCITSASTNAGDVMGLSWKPFKGGQPMTKFATAKSSEDVAREAVSRLIKLGAKAREAAAWYEQHPDKLFLPKGWEYMRGKDLTAWEICQIIGKEAWKSGTLRDKALVRAGETTDLKRADPNRPIAGRRQKYALYSYESVEHYLLNQCHPDWVKKKAAKYLEDKKAACRDYLIEHADNPQAAAAWYAQNPDALYIPERFEHLRNQPVTAWEYEQISGLIVTQWTREKWFKPTGERTNDPERTGDDSFIVIEQMNTFSTYTFDSLEKWVLGQISCVWPYLDKSQKLNYSESLFCLPKHIMDPTADTLEYVPDYITQAHLDAEFGNNPSGRTFFFRHDLRDANGELFKVTSHQFRHLINTLAQSKYLSQELIAFMSGRKSIAQNEWYNHVSQEAIIESYNRLGEQAPQIEVKGALLGKTQSMAAANNISQKAALEIELGAVHITRYGICRHDYSLTPCPKDKDCISCGEHLFTKGDERHLKEAEFQFEMHDQAVKRAEAAQQEGEHGVQRWLNLNVPKRDRWALALEMLSDPATPDGTLISLPAPQFQQSKTGLAIESAKLTESEEEYADLMAELAEMN